MVIRKVSKIETLRVAVREKGRLGDAESKMVGEVEVASFSGALKFPKDTQMS